MSSSASQPVRGAREFPGPKHHCAASLDPPAMSLGLVPSVGSDTPTDVMCVGAPRPLGVTLKLESAGDPALRPSRADERLPDLRGLGQPVGYDDEDRRVVAETEVAAAHLDVLPKRTGRQDRCSPPHDAVGTTVHGGHWDSDWPTSGPPSVVTVRTCRDARAARVLAYAPPRLHPTRLTRRPS